MRRCLPIERPRRLVLAVLIGVAAPACTRDDPMIDQPKFEPYEASPFFSDGASARERIPGTVAWTGRPAERRERPPVDLGLLHRGRERFNIFCSPCHGEDGHGEGIVVRRGYPLPPTFHQERLRAAPDEHFVAVIEKGTGRMPPYGSKVREPDRGAIVAYIRALQLSQHATLADAPEGARAELEKAAAQRPPQPENPG